MELFSKGFFHIILAGLLSQAVTCTQYVDVTETERKIAGLNISTKTKRSE